jgi:hypothetical protein
VAVWIDGQSGAAVPEDGSRLRTLGLSSSIVSRHAPAWSLEPGAKVFFLEGLDPSPRKLSCTSPQARRVSDLEYAVVA